MRIVSVIGARPQFIKAAPVSRAMRARNHEEIVIHTGQHYDAAMSEVFFKELGLAKPTENLGVGSMTHGRQTGHMMIRLEEKILQHRPDLILVYGDTNSTLAGALVAAKLHIPLAHVEAGMRSFNRMMPEEVNRVITDHCSQLLLCPTDTAVLNLKREGIVKGVHMVGDVMVDSLDWASEKSNADDLMRRLELVKNEFILATIHRAGNTDSPDRLTSILDGLADASVPVVLPLHPRTRNAIQKLGYRCHSRIKVIEPVGYLEMVALLRSAQCVVTDSGGLQKEAYVLKVPCVTVREETEWVETVDLGWNRLTSANAADIVHAIQSSTPPRHHQPLYGDGFAAVRCVERMEKLEDCNGS